MNSELQDYLIELDTSYKVATLAARAATVHGEDPTPFWRHCQRFYAMAKRARIQLLLEEWAS